MKADDPYSCVCGWSARKAEPRAPECWPGAVRWHRAVCDRAEEVSG